MTVEESLLSTSTELSNAVTEISNLLDTITGQKDVLVEIVDKSRLWANEDYDVQVEPGLYSAKHSALKAAEYAAQSIQGIQGVSGLYAGQGIQGVQGLIGSQGSQGIIGFQGTDGQYAGQGIQGIQGITGHQGTQGMDGTVGVDGLQGIQGVDGLYAGQGVQGIAGSQGIQGISGIGTDGVQGITGSQGIIGSQGIQGITGSQGIQGIQGRSGLQGFQGLLGTQGIQGVQGAQGVGIQGASGGSGDQYSLTNYESLIYNDESSSISHYSSVDESANLKLYSLSSNTYNYIKIEAIVETGNILDATNAPQTTWRINSAGVEQKSFVIRNIGNADAGADSGNVLIDTLSVIISGGQLSSTDITITAQHSVSNTSVYGKVLSFRIYSLQSLAFGSGAQGIQGVDGLYAGQGIQGHQGIQGYQGIQGTQGINGLFAGQGIQGTQGVQGRQGIQGINGLFAGQGIQGIQGIQGTTGINGTIGTDGAQGLQGYTGPSTTINASDDISTSVLYPVMVEGVSTNQTAKASVSKLTFDASTGALTSVSMNSSSDLRLKDNILDISNALDKVNKLKGVTFTRNDLNSNRRHIGVIAQDLINIIPEAVYQAYPDDYYTVAYGNLVALLIEAIKELDLKISNL